MKQIVIVRHAKAEELHEKINDFQRCLTKKGNKDSVTIAQRVKSLNVNPDIILTSTAPRALETAINFAGVFGFPDENIFLDEDIYHNFNPDKILAFIEKADNNKSTVFIFVHNPDLSYFAGELSRKEPVFLPKAAAYGLSFKTDSWENIRKAEREVIFFETP